MTTSLRRLKPDVRVLGRNQKQTPPPSARRIFSSIGVVSLPQQKIY